MQTAGSRAGLQRCSMATPVRRVLRSDGPDAYPRSTVPISRAQNRGASWSELHYSELDRGQPNTRVVLSVQKAVVSPTRGQGLGVLRWPSMTKIFATRCRAQCWIRPMPMIRTDFALLAVSAKGPPTRGS